jgi:hypothetical protein
VQCDVVRTIFDKLSRLAFDFGVQDAILAVAYRVDKGGRREFAKLLGIII